MKYPNQFRNGISQNKRRLRIEALEARLAFAIETSPIDVDLWMLAAAEDLLFVDEQRQSGPGISNDASDPWGSEAFFQDFNEGPLAILAQPAAGLAAALPAVDEVFSTDIGLKTVDESQSRVLGFTPTIRHLGQTNEATLLLDVLGSTNSPVDIFSPLSIDELGKITIPAVEYTFPAYEVSDGLITAIVPSEPSAAGQLAFPESTYFGHGLAGFAVGPATRLDERPLNIGEPTVAPTLHAWHPVPIQAQDEKNWNHDGRSHSNLENAPSHTDPMKRFPQRYQTLGEILQQHGIELGTDSQLPIEKDHSKTSSSSRRHDRNHETSMEVDQANAVPAIHRLPPGMLAIGGEASMHTYRRAHSLRLKEDFVVQTELICDDLTPIAALMNEPAVPLDDESLKFGLQRRLHWIAIGGTILIAQASLVAHKSRDASIHQWLVVKMPKFKKHDPDESL